MGELFISELFISEPFMGQRPSNEESMHIE
jgi:hypothetical protein